ncbi:S8 family peptidase [Saccharomonospora azurea]|uniref:Subtilisin-like serine protease n=1 Tax=Saccharomonospora azurea NA-128 TaxID=882081 RepID=H8GE63_9PSEU|nr:S8 family serine peptidase [Saccharomonospora azurea]EHY90945.1 subtilisin-like serine protease [Saccharomonospora azurea NA-128]
MHRSASVALLTIALVLGGTPVAARATSSAATDECTPAGPTERYLVVLPPRTSEADAAAEVHDACGELGTYHPEISVGVAHSSDHRFSTRLGSHRTFRSAQPDSGAELATSKVSGSTASTPSTDLAEGRSTDLSGRQWNLRAVRAEQAHARQRGSADVVVGVLDSGIDPTHPDLRHAVAADRSVGCLSGTPDTAPESWQATTSPHGTHVAGLLAAADDGRGVTGIAPGVRVASVRVVDDHGRVSPEAAVCGLMWAAEHRFPVVNGSFLVSPWSAACARGPGREVVRDALRRALHHAHERGTLTVVAASNKAARLTPSHTLSAPASSPAACEALPAGLRDAVSVSASDRKGRKAGYSAYGLGVIDLTAPGGDHGDCLLSTVPGGYGTLCGTSMAAPHVAGVAALVASEHPRATPQRLRAALTSTATAVPCPGDYDLTGNGIQDAFCEGYTGYNGFYGHGRVDAPGALAAASSPR